MKTWTAFLVMACLIGNASAQTTMPGNSDTKQRSSTEKHAGKADASTDTKGGSSNGAARKGIKTSKRATAGKAASTGGVARGVAPGVGIAAGVGAIAIAAAAGGGGHDGSDRSRASSP